MDESTKEGRDSWLVNWVLGKKDTAVFAAKSWRQLEEVLLRLEFGLRGSGKLEKGLGQQPLRHTCVTSLMQGRKRAEINKTTTSGRQERLLNNGRHYQRCREKKPLTWCETLSSKQLGNFTSFASGKISVQS